MSSASAPASVYVAPTSMFTIGSPSNVIVGGVLSIIRISPEVGYVSIIVPARSVPVAILKY